MGKPARGRLAAGAVVAAGAVALFLYATRRDPPAPDDFAPESRADGRDAARAGVRGGEGAAEGAVDGGAGEPQPCARVQLRGPDGEPTRGRLASRFLGDDDEWRVDEDAGPGEVVVCGPGDTALALRARGEGGRGGARIVDPSRWRDQVVGLRVDEPVTVRGVVTDEDGAPIEGARVTVARHDRGSDLPPMFNANDAAGLYADARVASDADGRFEVRIFGRRFYIVGAEADGYAREWVGPVASRRGERDEVAIRLRPAVTLEVVVTANGAPLEGARLVVHPSNLAGAFPTHTLADGRYRLEGQHPDARFEVSASADGFRGESLHEVPAGPVSIALTAAATVHVPVVVPAPLDACVGAPPIGALPHPLMLGSDPRGRLEGDGGRSFGRYDAARGELTFHGVPPGTAALSVWLEGAVEHRAEVVVPPGESALAPVALELEPGVGWLRVHSAEPAARYRLEDASGRPELVTPFWSEWACHALAPGRWTVRAARDEVVEVREGARTDVTVESPPHQDPLDLPHDCRPAFGVHGSDGIVEVIELDPQATGDVQPGDHILEVDAPPAPTATEAEDPGEPTGDEPLPAHSIVNLLDAPDDRPARLLIERPDGSRAWVTVPRVCD